MDNRLTKRCTTASVTREMQVKSIMRHHFTPAIIKKKKDELWQVCEERGTPLHFCW